MTSKPLGSDDRQEVCDGPVLDDQHRRGGEQDPRAREAEPPPDQQGRHGDVQEDAEIEEIRVRDHVRASASLRRSALPLVFIGKLSMNENRRGIMYAGRCSIICAFQLAGQLKVRAWRPLVQNHEGGERIDGPLLEHRQDHGIADPRQGPQVRLDIRRLDPVAVQLDLVVDPAFKEKHAIPRATPVAGPVGSLAAELKERGSVQLGPVQVARADVGAGDDDLAALARW